MRAGGGYPSAGPPLHFRELLRLPLERFRVHNKGELSFFWIQHWPLAETGRVLCPGDASSISRSGGTKRSSFLFQNLVVVRFLFFLDFSRLTTLSLINCVYSARSMSAAPMGQVPHGRGLWSDLFSTNFREFFFSKTRAYEARDLLPYCQC